MLTNQEKLLEIVESLLPKRPIIERKLAYVLHVQEQQAKYTKAEKAFYGEEIWIFEHERAQLQHLLNLMDDYPNITAKNPYEPYSPHT